MSMKDGNVDGRAATRIAWRIACKKSDATLSKHAHTVCMPVFSSKVKRSRKSIIHCGYVGTQFLDEYADAVCMPIQSSEVKSCRTVHILCGNVGTQLSDE